MIEGAAPGNGPPGAPSGLSVVAGDGQLALSWNAPAFGGGSAITNYRVYRGTAPGGESFLTDTGTTRSFVDSSVANGTTYYYKVTAENGNGEGALSSAASGTPLAAQAPEQPLPTIDAFNRPNESPLSDAGRWANLASGAATTLAVNNNQLACTLSTTCSAWRNPTTYGPDTEVWARITTLPGTTNQLRLYARLQQPSGANWDGYMLRTNQLAGPDELYLERIDNGNVVSLLTMSQELAAGDTLLLRTKGPTLEVWRNNSSTWTRLGTTQDTTYTTPGNSGIGLRGTTGRLDDFGTRTLGNPPPGAPSGLSVVAGDGQLALSWNAPAFGGGSAITNYRVYRGTAPGGESFLTDTGTTRSFVDSSVANGTTYYYKVTAENGNGEGALSSAASGTPLAAQAPEQPLPTIDAFNRPNESPLSDAGRWANLASGAATTLAVNNNQLACTLSTTCSAWRNPTTYGPDTEVWARITTLPGTTNQLRLYARLQQPSGANWDGYMLRTNQLAGPDELYLERIDNGNVVSLLTMSQELAAGDTLLLRTKGPTLEVWRNNSSTWTRLGTTQDTTYTTPGNSGIGLRGTTGRLDDFGTRTLGVPPDTTPPNAPGNLQAAAGGTKRIDLTWVAATDDGGDVSYRVERCQGGGCADFTEIGTTTETTYSDTGLVAATSYSYRVRAEDPATNLGPYSSVATATTQPVAPDTPPVEPLPVVDSFDRPNESPLSDAGRWANLASGAATTLAVNNNQLACTLSTTCSAWRNPTTYGPDTEVWARITTLPGTTNQLRLYARLQQPSGANWDGYMLRTNQLAGPDELYLERIDNGNVVSLLTMSQELAAGDTLLLRVQGTTLQVWRRSGTTWSQLGKVDDSTYDSAGSVGVALRGKIGRLDDFGAR